MVGCAPSRHDAQPELHAIDEDRQTADEIVQILVEVQAALGRRPSRQARRATKTLVLRDVAAGRRREAERGAPTVAGASVRSPTARCGARPRERRPRVTRRTSSQRAGPDDPGEPEPADDIVVRGELERSSPLTIAELVGRTGWTCHRVYEALRQLGAIHVWGDDRRFWRLPPGRGSLPIERSTVPVERLSLAIDDDPLADLDVAHAEQVLASTAAAGNTPRACRCERPVMAVDEDGRRCARCGHRPES